MKNRESLTPQSGSILLGLFAFAFVIIVGYGSDLIFVHHPEWMIADDLALAFIVASLVVLWEEWRIRSIRAKLNVIREMNSFIRNELQVLIASVPGHAAPQTVGAVERCVDRIEWALREILPGKQGPSAQQIPDSRARANDSTQRPA